MKERYSSQLASWREINLICTLFFQLLDSREQAGCGMHCGEVTLGGQSNVACKVLGRFHFYRGRLDCFGLKVQCQNCVPSILFFVPFICSYIAFSM